MSVQSRKLIQYVVPAMLGSISFFLFTIVDGIFVGRGVGTNALGASDAFYPLTTEYLFWYSVFIIPSGLSTALQGFCRNDGSHLLVSAATIIGTAVNIVGDYLLIFPLQMGVAGAACPPASRSLPTP